MKRLELGGTLLAGSLGSLLVARSSWLEADDPLRTTAILLPFLVASFVALGRHARGLGARRLPPSRRALELLGLGGFALALAARPRLGLEGAELPLAAAGALLLALVVGSRLLAWRPLLGRELSLRPAGVFFFLPLLAYLAILPWSTGQRPPDGDEPWYLLVTHSLAYDFDSELTNNYHQGDWKGFLSRPMEPQPGDPHGRGGELYSRHNALLPLMLAPAYRLAGKWGALATMAALAAALAWMTLRLAARYFPSQPAGALLAYGLLAFAPPLLLYSGQIWVEVPAALAALVAIDAMRALTGESAPGPAASTEPRRRRWRQWLVLAAAIAFLPLLKIRFMLLAAPLAALAWWRTGRPWKVALVLGAALGALGGGILLHNQWLYGNALKIHSWQEVELHHYTFGQYFLGGTGLFCDAAFGLFGCAPLWLLSIPAGGKLLLRRHPLLLDLEVLSLPYLAIVVPRSEWYGGWSPPFRYALVALPLLALLLVPLAEERRRFGPRFLLAALGAVTLALTLLWVSVPGWTYNFADGRTYLLDHLARSFGADFARFLPSSVRPRLASWLWPPVLAVGLPALWWWPLRGRRGRPAAWGTGVVVALLGLLIVAAHRVPTGRIELEDAQVVKAGGHLFPDPWVIDRTRYRGGWVLLEGDRLEAPVVPGGRRLRLALEAQLMRRHPGPVLLELSAGETVLAELTVTTNRTWRRYELPDLAWPAVRSLRLSLKRGPGSEGGNAVLLDFVELQWQ